MNARRWLLPSLGTMIWLVVLLVLCLSDWRLVMINADGDPSLHWRIGHWMIEHRAVIRVDQFSHTRFGAPLISKEWLSEVIFAAANDRFGWSGAVLVGALLIATTLWLLYRWLLAEGCEPLLATGLVLLAALASSHHWLARPHLTTLLLTVVFARRLRAFDGDPKAGALGLLVPLIPLMTLWANLHGAFFTGFVLLGVYVAGNLARPKKAVTIVIVGAACVAASLINPNGWHLHAHIVQFLREPVLAKFANEFRSPNFHSGAMSGFLLQLLLLVVLLIVVRPRLRATDVLLVGVWGYLALQAARNVPIFAIIVTPILAEHWQAAMRNAGSGRMMERYRRLSASVARIDHATDGYAIVVVVLIVLLGTLAKPTLFGGKTIVATEILPDHFPVAATRFFAAHPRAVSGEMFNDYGWGGYLMLAMPEHRVFVDGRNDFYGPELIQDFDTVNRAHPGWDDVLRKYKVGWTILPRAHPLNELLALRKDWSLSYTDEVATIYSRRSE
jgi:hypothetical protein